MVKKNTLGAIKLTKKPVEKKADPKVEELQMFKAKLETIFKDIGLDTGNIVATKDLQAKKPRDPLICEVKSEDIIVLSAGKDVLVYSFMSLEEGMLPVIAFRNNHCESDHLIQLGESKVVGTGLLTDIQGYTITLSRSDAQWGGCIARIEIKASFGPTQIPESPIVPVMKPEGQ